MNMHRLMLTILFAIGLVLPGHAVEPAVKSQARPTPMRALNSDTQALLAAQQWLKSIRYDRTIEQMKAMKALRLQMYGNINGVSTQQLISNDNLRHLKVLGSLEELALPRWTNDQGFSNVSGLVNLKTLNAPDAPITNQSMTYLRQLTHLESLVLTNGQIDDQGVSHLGGLTNLKILNLSNTKITDAGVQQLSGLQNVEKLFLNRTTISDACVPDLMKLKKLVRLDITGTKITDAGRGQLRQAIPGIQIH